MRNDGDCLIRFLVERVCKGLCMNARVLLQFLGGRFRVWLTQFVNCKGNKAQPGLK